MYKLQLMQMRQRQLLEQRRNRHQNIIQQIKDLETSASHAYTTGKYTEALEYYSQERTLLLSSKDLQGLFPDFYTLLGYSEYFIGRIYYDSNQKEQAKEYFKCSKKRSQNIYEAALGLGKIYTDEEKSEKAIGELRRALKSNDQDVLTKALSGLLQIVLKTQTPLLHKNELAQCIRTAIELQEKDFLDNLVQYLLYCIQDIDSAIHILNQVNSDAAKSMLADIVQSDRFHRKNILLAIELLNEIVTHATLEPTLLGKAHCNLAILYDTNLETLSEHQKALHHYEQAIQYGHNLAYYHLGYKYQCGEGVPCDPERSASYFKQAVKTIQHKISLFELGVCYATGSGVKENSKKAKSYFLQAYEKGFVDAGFYLGGLYFKEGRDEEAIRFFEEAERNGAGVAAFSLGLIYDNGVGETQINLETAERYYQKAAQKGIKIAYHNLAIIKIKQLQSLEDPEKRKQCSQEISTLIEQAASCNNQKTSTLYRIINECDDTYLTQICNEELEELKHKECLSLNKTILEICSEQSTPQQKVFSILQSLQIETKDAINYATAIHRIGTLLSQNAAVRELVVSQFDQIEILLFEIEQIIEQMSNRTFVNLVEGWSKFFISHTTTSTQHFFHILYGQVTTRSESFFPLEWLIILHSLARMDIQEELTLLISFIIERATPHLNSSDLTSFLFHLAVLDHYYFHTRDETLLKNREEIKNIITQLLTSDVLDQNDIAITRSLYFAVFYFVKRYPEEFRQFEEILSQTLYCDLQSLINSDKNSDEIHISRLQQSVLRDLEKKYDCQSEIFINSLPVDIVILNTQNEQIILQIDGPSHFLFNQYGITGRTPKDYFHDFILQNSPRVRTIIHIPYYEWDELKTNQEKESYLTRQLQPSKPLKTKEVPLLSETPSTFFHYPRRRRRRGRNRRKNPQIEPIQQLTI